MFPLFGTGVVDTGSKFAAGVVDTGGKLPLVSLIPVVHLDLQISPQIFEKKIVMFLMLLSEAWGKMIHEKNQKQNS